MIGIFTLFTHFINGILIVYLMTIDIGAFHQKSLAVLGRLAIISWWCFDLEHLAHNHEPDIKRLLSQLCVMTALVVISLALQPIKKLIK